MGFQALTRIYNLRLRFSEFRASHIVKRLSNKRYNISPHQGVLIQNLPQGKNANPWLPSSGYSKAKPSRAYTLEN
ncbi:hypothetical protein F0562_012065 [Nyssa sinensis]|uniref:Uncharacterized protein n=1 Tax=Nyssa sinensis TaxID=561372 RepID=A0A5J4ZRB4_9ASTE|nr:hypothetical protein F0562_012065 [Nyssa sinensis]